MKAAEALLDTFINANILFAVGFILWLAVRAVMDRVGLKQAFATQLLLLNAVFAVIILAPFIVLGFRSLQASGVAQQVNLNLSDMVVAYYLNGGFEMDSSKFESLVLSRDGFVLNLLNADGLLAQTLILLFCVGFLAGLLRIIVSVRCLRRIVSHSYPLRRVGRVQILISDRTTVPFSTRGLRRYSVVIPSYMLSQKGAMNVALAHEFQHIRQGDLRWEVALEALKPFFFLNPAFHAWKHQVEHLRELTCDKKILSLGRIDVRSYCDTLLSVSEKTLRRDTTFALAVPKVTLVSASSGSEHGKGRSFLEQRIRSALDKADIKHPRLLFLAIALPLLLAVSLTTIAIQSPGDWSHDRLMLSTVVNLDRLDEINRMSAFGSARN